MQGNPTQAENATGDEPTTKLLDSLQHLLCSMGRVAVAYSGGVDSTLVLKVAYDCLGDGAIGLLAVSPSLPSAEQEAAQRVAAHIGVDLVCLDTNEIAAPGYRANGPDRCYHCKSEVYGVLTEYVRTHGYHDLLDGTNADDVGDHRPGRQAARERRVRSPLLEVGLGKQAVRALARQLGLPNWDKPAAACLASRVPYGTAVEVRVLSQVEQAEAELKAMGFGRLRVRHHGNVARIELPPERLAGALARRNLIVSRLQQVGYAYVTLDLAGFRSGSMNEVLSS